MMAKDEINATPWTPRDMDKHCVKLLQDSVFWATVSWHVRKYPSEDVPTIGVRFNKDLDCFDMPYNPQWMANLEAAGNKRGPGIGDKYVRSILKHEYSHIVYGHVTERMREPHNLHNIASDASIDSLLESWGEVLPTCTILPGSVWCKPWGNEPQDDPEIVEIIQNWPKLKATDWYFADLMKEARARGWPKEKIMIVGMPGAGGIPGSGDHSGHGSGSGTGEENEGDAEGDYIAQKAKEIVQDAVKQADRSSSNGWGNMPAEMQNEIRRSVSNIVDWRTLLKQFAGTVLRGDRRHSMKRINKKYPYIHAGTKRSYLAKLLVTIDESGSVGDDAVSLFFGELGSLTRRTTIDVVSFDTQVSEKDLVTWKKGKDLPPMRNRCGGTDFNAPTRFANDPKNRGRWDGVIIMTDGECYKPEPSRMKRAYVICPGRKLQFEPDPSDIVIDMNQDRNNTPKGSWR